MSVRKQQKTECGGEKERASLKSEMTEVAFDNIENSEKPGKVAPGMERSREMRRIEEKEGEDPGDASFLEKKLERLATGNDYPFHMPGHKRVFSEDCCMGQEARKRDGASKAALAAAMRIDITEIDGFDDLHDAEGILREEMRLAAAMRGAKETIFSVNGSTCGILAAISAAVPFGGRILVARNCHRSVYHAIYLRHLEADYIMPSMGYLSREDIACAGGAVNAENVEKAFRASYYDAVVITSPTYDGIVSDIAAIAEVAHAHGAVLIVDAAHGAHFGMHPYFPEMAAVCGADLVIESLHKTLPALTQTALLHNVTGRVPSARLGFFMDIFETSSPSYVLLASITHCIAFLRKDGEVRFAEYAAQLAALREKLAGLKHLSLLAPCKMSVGEGKTRKSSLSGASGHNSSANFTWMRELSYDPSKILIGTNGSGITGPELYDLLRTEFHLQPEMKTPSYVLLMTSVADTQEGFDRLAEALFTIDARLEGFASGDRSYGDSAVRASEVRGYAPLYAEALPNVRMSLAEALDGDPERLQEMGVAGYFAECYPPDIPLLVPGEEIPPDFEARVRALQAAGIKVRISR